MADAEREVPQEITSEERRKRMVRMLSVEEVQAIEYRWKYDYKTPTNHELECMMHTAEFAMSELEHIFRQRMEGEDG